MDGLSNGSDADHFNITADIEAPASLIEAAISIVDPPDIYVGQAREPAELPRNIIAFRRTGTFSGKNPHAHHRHVFIIPLRGERSVIVDELTYRICPGRALLIFPYQFHHYGSLGDEDLVWLFITFEGSKEPSWTQLRNTPCHMTPHTWHNIARFAELNAAPPDHDLRDKEWPLLLALVLAGLVRDDDSRTGTTGAIVPLSHGDRLVQKVSQCVFEHLDSPFDIHDLARELGMSYSHLRNVFKGLTGTSIGTYMRLVRIHQACVLLMNTDNTVSEISAACGFDSVYSFSRAFKREVGVPPSVYRSEDYSVRMPRPGIRKPARR